MSSAIAAATSPESGSRAELTGADWDRFRRTALYAAGWRPRRVRDRGAPPLVDRRHRSPPAVLPVLPGGVQLLAGRRVGLPGVPHAAIRHRRRLGPASAAHPGGGGRHAAAFGRAVPARALRSAVRLEVHAVEPRADQRGIALQGRLAQRDLRPRPGGHLLRLLDRHGPAVPRAGRSSRTRVADRRILKRCEC